MNENSGNGMVSVSSVPAHCLCPELVVKQPSPLPPLDAVGGTAARSCGAKTLDLGIPDPWEIPAHFG